MLLNIKLYKASPDTTTILGSLSLNDVRIGDIRFLILSSLIFLKKGDYVFKIFNCERYA